MSETRDMGLSSNSNHYKYSPCSKMKSWILSTRLPVILAVSVLFLTTSVLLLYLLFGHWLIETMYQRKTVQLLNKLITGQQYHTVDHYLMWGDVWIVKYALYTLLLCLFLRVASRDVTEACHPC